MEQTKYPFEMIAQALKPSTQLFKLSAINLTTPIWVRKGMTITHSKRIKEGDIVGIQNNELTHETVGNSWQIKQCRGTLDNSRFEVDLLNTETKENKTIKF